MPVIDGTARDPSPETASQVFNSRPSLANTSSFPAGSHAIEPNLHQPVFKTPIEEPVARSHRRTPLLPLEARCLPSGLQAGDFHLDELWPSRVNFSPVSICPTYNPLSGWVVVQAKRWLSGDQCPPTTRSPCHVCRTCQV